MRTIVISENAVSLAELVAGARECGSAEVRAVLIGNSESIGQASECGADSFAYIELPEDAMLEDCAISISHDIQAGGFDTVFVYNDDLGRLLLGKLSALLETSALVECMDFSEGVAKHLCMGGKLVRGERCKGITLVGFPPASFDAKQSGPSVDAEVIEFEEPPCRFRVIDSKPVESNDVDLAGAKRVVCVGLGSSESEQIESAKKLASMIDGALGCTRPVVDGDNPPLPKKSYIGASGVTVKPDLLFELGCSGQMQHIMATFDSRVVVSVNKDPNAPVVRQSDYVLVADVDDVLPVLLSAL